MIDSTMIDALPSGYQVVGWISSVAAAAGATMAMRRRGSTDARERAKDAAETNYFSTAIDSITVDRDKWKERALETAVLLSKANETIARMTALHEAHVADIAELREQVHMLREISVKFAPEGLRDALTMSLLALPGRIKP